MKARKKPVVVETFQWTADINQKEDPIWIIEAIKNGDIFLANVGTENVEMRIKTIDSIAIAVRGDYIIKGVNGEFYPCKPDIFEKTYEIVEETK